MSLLAWLNVVGGSLSHGLYQGTKHLLLLSAGKRKQQSRPKSLTVSNRAGNFKHGANRLQMDDTD